MEIIEDIFEETSADIINELFENIFDEVLEPTIQELILEAYKDLTYCCNYMVIGQVYYIKFQVNNMSIGIKDLNLLLNPDINRYCDKDVASEIVRNRLLMLTEIGKTEYFDMFVHYTNLELFDTHNILIFDEPEIRISEYFPLLEESYRISSFLLTALKVLHKEFKIIHGRLSRFVICKYGDIYKLDIPMVFDEVIGVSTQNSQYTLDHIHISPSCDITSACIIMLELFLRKEILISERREEIILLHHKHIIDQRCS